MIFHVLTLFPELYPGPLGVSVFKKARHNNLFDLKIYPLKNENGRVDDAPFGGGAGMVLGCEAVHRAVSALDDDVRQNALFVVFSPRGPMLDGARSRDFARGVYNHIVMLCPRFEGVDQRVVDWWGFRPVSVGPAILAGGDVAAYVFLESVLRFVPGVVGNEVSLERETSVEHFAHHHYTRPRSWRGVPAPDVLLSGHHGRVQEWRKKNQRMVTKGYGFF